VQLVHSCQTFAISRQALRYRDLECCFVSDSKSVDAPYRSGPSKTWLKTKNPASEAVRREREERWL
jgi:hypothetical protein